MMQTESRITNLARKTFGYHKTGWIGIDIGSSSIRIAQVKKQNDGWELLNHQILPLQNCNTQSANLTESVVETLKAQPMLFSLFNGRKAATVLPLSIAPLQSMNVPDGTPRELRMMIQQDLQMQSSEEDTNVNNAEKEFVYWKENLSQQNEEGMIQTSVVSAPREEILQVAKCMLAASVHCQVVSVQPLAIAKAIQLHDGGSSETVQAGFEWGTTSPLFTIVQNGQPLFSRVFRHCGFEQITRLLQDRMGLTFLESLQLLSTFQSPGHPEEMKTVGQAISEMIVTPLKMLAREFGKTLEFIKQKRPDLFPNQMWLFGTGAGLCQVENQLSEMTGIKSRLWTLPTQNQPLQSNVSKQLQAKLGPAIALSAMGYE